MGEYLDWLHEEVARRGLQSKVLLLGRFPVECMPSFYAHADVLLVSLKKDPVFSLTIPGKVQSYLNGRCTDIWGCWMVRARRSSQIQMPAWSALLATQRDLHRQCLRCSAMSADQTKLLGMNGRVFVQKEFGRKSLMDQLEVLLHEAVDLHRQVKMAT
jgi:hypothetical protein